MILLNIIIKYTSIIKKNSKQIHKHKIIKKVSEAFYFNHSFFLKCNIISEKYGKIFLLYKNY